MNETDTKTTDPHTAARRALAEAVHVRRAVRRAHDAYPPGRPERRTAASLLRALDAVVRRQIHTAHTAGVTTTDIAHTLDADTSQVGRTLEHRPG